MNGVPGVPLLNRPRGLTRLSPRGWLLTLYCFLCPWMNGIVQVGDVYVAATDLLLPFAICFLFFGRIQWRNPALVLITVYPLIAWLSVSLSSEVTVNLPLLLHVVRLAGVVCPFALAYSARRTESLLVPCARSFFVGGAISIALAAVRFWWGIGWRATSQTFVFENGKLDERAGGVFGDVSAFGHMFATWAVIVIVVYAWNVRGTKRWAIILSVVMLGTLAVGISLSRAALANWLAAISVAALLPEGGRRTVWGWYLRLAATGLAVAIALLLATSDYQLGTPGLPVIAQRIVEPAAALFSGNGSMEQVTSGRWSTWHGVFDLWATHPFLGIGYKRLTTAYGLAADNTFLLALAETGMVGSICLGGFWLAVLWKSVKCLSARSPFGRPLVILWVSQTVHGVFVDTLTFFGSMTPLLIVLGLYLAHSASSKPMNAWRSAPSTRLPYVPARIV